MKETILDRFPVLDDADRLLFLIDCPFVGDI